ncbi:hypothetical protein F5Y18DRAFT_325952 [Xylariaceae sp. FL1019]|nr:hypothetical protein F5Y18DRAFT_325952 [Xylariaceae sp. FL1019]
MSSSGTSATHQRGRVVLDKDHVDRPLPANGTKTDADVNRDDGGWTEVIYKHGAEQEDKPRKIPRPIYNRPKKAYALKPEFQNTFGTSFRNEKPAAPASKSSSSAGSPPRAKGERRYQGQGHRQAREREHDPARLPGWYQGPSWDVRPKRQGQGQAKREAKKAQTVKAEAEKEQK